jgi:ribonuclease R
LVGERGGHVYRLGDKMTVLVARVDLDERKIDFEPVETEGHDG